MEQYTIIPFKRLVMISGGQCCMCNNPDPLCNPHTWHINIESNITNNLGYITCNKEECQSKMRKYIKWLYSNLYVKPIWQVILKKFANNEYISVPRNIGIVEHNWIIESKLYMNKYINTQINTQFNTQINDDSGLNDNLHLNFGISSKFILAMLCNFSSETEIPSYIWYKIYDMCLYLYQPHIKVILDYNSLIEKMNYLIVCEKPNSNMNKILHKSIDVNIFEELNKI